MEANLNWTASGQGLPLVLLHGFPFDSTIWQALDGLDRVARVLTPDLPGFGDSAPLPGAPDAATIEDYARAVLTWADGLRLDSFALAGHSMGGYIALALAHLAPHRLAGLILICSKAAPDTPEGAEGRHKLAAAVAEQGPQAVVDAMLPKLFAPGAPLSVRETTRTVMLGQSVPGIQAALYAMASRPDSRPRLPALPTPALIVAGADDGIIPPEVAQETRDGLRNAAYVEIPHAGHMPMLENPEALVAALQPFVGGLTPPIIVPPGS